MDSSPGYLGGTNAFTRLLEGTINILHGTLSELLTKKNILLTPIVGILNAFLCLLNDLETTDVAHKR